MKRRVSRSAPFLGASSIAVAIAAAFLAPRPATAQTIPVPPIGGCGQTQMLFFDDGTPETSWKVSNPTGAGDSFSVDFDA